MRLCLWYCCTSDHVFKYKNGEKSIKCTTMVLQRIWNYVVFPWNKKMFNWNFIFIFYFFWIFCGFQLVLPLSAVLVINRLGSSGAFSVAAHRAIATIEDTGVASWCNIPGCSLQFSGMGKTEEEFEFCDYTYILHFVSFQGRLWYLLN